MAKLSHHNMSVNGDMVKVEIVATQNEENFSSQRSDSGGLRQRQGRINRGRSLQLRQPSNHEDVRDHS